MCNAENRLKAETTYLVSNYDAMPRVLHVLPDKGPNVHAIFMRWTLNFLYACYVCPCRNFEEWAFVFVFVAENLGSLETHKSPKKTQKQENNYKKQNKTQPITDRQGLYNMCAKSRGLSPKKRRELWLLSNKIGAVWLYQPLLVE